MRIPFAHESLGAATAMEAAFEVAIQITAQHEHDQPLKINCNLSAHSNQIVDEMAVLERLRLPSGSSTPLTEKEEQVLAVIREHPNGITGPAIVKTLWQDKNKIGLSELTSRIIPKLKLIHGVQNRRNVGYYIPNAT